MFGQAVTSDNIYGIYSIGKKFMKLHFFDFLSVENELLVEFIN